MISHIQHQISLRHSFFLTFSASPKIEAQDKTIENISDRTQFPIQTETHYYQDLPFPACVFFFTMQDDRGYYQWLKYPLLPNQILDPEERDRIHPLDENTLSQIIDAIAAWYDTKQYFLA